MHRKSGPGRAARRRGDGRIDPTPSHPRSNVGRMRIAIVGATGAVGEVLRSELADLAVDPDRLDFFASPRSDGTRLPYRGEGLPVRVFQPESVAEGSLVFFSAGATVSRAAVPAVLDRGAVVIDNSSAFRRDPAIPLVVPEVNGRLLEVRPVPRLVANPNCSTAQLVCALAPLDEAFGLEEVVVSTYQSVSGTGRRALAALAAEIREVAPAGTLRHPDSPYSVPIAGNLIPEIGRVNEHGYGEEETKLRDETRRILERPDLPVHATAVRVPTRRGHGESVTVRCRTGLDRSDALVVLARAPGLRLSPVRGEGSGPDGADAWTTPQECEGEHTVFVGRVRVAPDDRRRLQFWVISDNLLKGAAWNAVQIAQGLGLLPGPGRTA